MSGARTSCRTPYLFSLFLFTACTPPPALIVAPSTLYENALDYVLEIAADDPLGHWRLDKGREGAIVSDMDGAMHFDGSVHRLLVAPDFGGMALTAEFWIRDAERGTILSYHDGDAEAFALQCAEGELNVKVLSERHETGLTCGEAGRWSHIGVSWQGVTGETLVAVDGRVAWRSALVAAADITRGGAVVLGQRQACPGACLEDGLVGSLDEVALYDRVLHPSRLRSHTMVGKGHRHPSPVNHALKTRIQPQFSHRSNISFMKFNPDGTRLATVDIDGVIKLWDVATGRLMADLIKHKDWVEGLEFTSDGRLIVSASADHTIIVWDASDGSILHRLTAHMESVTLIETSPDGLHLVSASDDGSIRLWDLQSGRQLREFKAEKIGDFYSMKISPDGEFLAVGGFSNLKVWRMETGELLFDEALHKDSINGLAFHSDEKLIATGSDDGTVCLFDLVKGERVLRTEPTVDSDGDPIPIDKVEFAYDKRRVLAFRQGTVQLIPIDGRGPTRGLECCDESEETLERIPQTDRFISARKSHPFQEWDMDSAQMSRTFGGPRAAHTSMAISPNGETLASFDTVNGVSIRDIASGKEVHNLSGKRSNPSVAIFSPDGRQVASNDQAKLWDVETGRLQYSLLDSVDLLSFNPLGTLLAMTTYKKGLALADTRTGALVFHIPQIHTADITSLSFSPDGETIATTSKDGRALLWDLKGTLTLSLLHKEAVSKLRFVSEFEAVTASEDKVHHWDIVFGDSQRVIDAGETVNDLIVSADGAQMFTATDDLLIKRWDVTSGALLTKMTGHWTYPIKMSPSGNGKKMASIGMEQDIVIWDLKSNELHDVASGHTAALNDIDFSPNGNHIATVSDDRTLRIWWSGLLEKTIHLDTRPLSIDFSPDGRRLVAACEDSTIKIWNLDGDGVIMMISEGQRWLTFTEDHFFDASPDGGSLVAMVKGSRVFGVDQMALTHNRPDILIDRLGQASFEPESTPTLPKNFFSNMSALGINRGDFPLRRQRLDALKAHFKARALKRLKKAGLDTKSSSISIDLPQARILQSYVEGGTLKMELSFKARKSLASYQVFVNDVPAFATAAPLTGKKVHVSAEVELGAGANKIEVAARDVHGFESLRSLTTAVREETIEGKLYFVGFGVSDYQHNAQIPDLQYAHQDVLDLAEYFSGAERGYSETHVHVFIDEAVNPNSIREARSLIAEAGVHDTLVLFVAGHGVRDEDEAHTYYYLTHGSKLDDLPGTAVRFETIESLLYDSRPRNKLFLMDTCQSGEIDEDFGAAPSQKGSRGLKARAVPTTSARSAKAFGVAPKPALNAERLTRDRFIYADLSRRSGAIVLSSSRGQEYSLEGPAYENGAFTEELLKALQSQKADTNADGSVSTNELRKYVIESVPKLTNGLQHPTVDRDNIHQVFSLPIVPETVDTEAP